MSDISNLKQRYHYYIADSLIRFSNNRREKTFATTRLWHYCAIRSRCCHLSNRTV